ncbi:DUF6364 family protein [Mucilaginibacter sp.]|uniref:DUF6364 family protein n=1 Tax=Mucilaginibacter sp. TaxID=1882438 RepID=UPI000CC613BE|nr:DUF6364 family protein [Mucilaginibacter sp.]PLW88937.1 MAG: hypothetical protein C0154_14120 [Mucilaginibacter sp.]HEK20919.1 hypothetical protein [Bacteroidota bacterium]
MATKLTLSTDDDTVALAKRLASNNNISVSKLFKKLLNEFSKTELKKDPLLEKYEKMEFSDDIKALSGILKGKVPDDVNIWDCKYEYLKEKYDL